MNRQSASPAAIEHGVVTILLKGQLISGRPRALAQPLKRMDTVKDRREKKKQRTAAEQQKKNAVESMQWSAALNN